MRKLTATLMLVFGALFYATVWAGPMATDPGVRMGSPGAGFPMPNLTPLEMLFFSVGQNEFEEVEGVAKGLGPRFNMDSCGGCHAHPDVGGTSPFVNPQVAVATKAGALNIVPFFITTNGPVREARFKFKMVNGKVDRKERDGSVHNLFTITGRVDARDCNITQPDFNTAAKKYNLIFRIPTPVFGAGLIENIPDATILKNKNSNIVFKQMLGINGRENRNANDQTITRFGWKAQNKSLLMFAGEAYNVEQGVSNELFPQERDSTVSCLLNPLPEDHTNFEGTTPTEILSGIELFSFFMRMLAPPTPTPDTTSTTNGRKIFNRIGCSLCHIPTLTTGHAAIAALSNQKVNLFSDLLLHDMGSDLADDILQGSAGPSEFRTAPLWGVGQRIFFLHDGRTSDLLEAINAHRSPGSEASRVIKHFNDLAEVDKQDLLNFSRSL